MKNLLINKTGRIKKSLVIHPILLAIFPVLFLYIQNINQTSTQQALSPLWTIVPGTLLLWLLLYLWMRNILKAGLATTLFVILFFSYGRIYTWLVERDIVVLAHGILLPLLILLWGYAAYFIKTARRNFKNTTQVLNLVALVLVVVNLFNLISYQIGKPVKSSSDTQHPENIPTAQAASVEIRVKPDIYFIILDEYASPDVIKKDYGYDNSQFIDNLKDQGFFIASESQMHNRETIRSIASILNMEYTPETESEEVSYRRIENNAVVNYLRPLGYQYIYLGQWYEKGRYEIPADTYFNYYETGNTSFTTEFSATLWNTTILYPFYNYLTGQVYEGYYRNGLLQTLSQLKKVPDLACPKFVYAHIICPHAPYVFGPDGERIAPSDYYDFYDKQYYLGQYIFISTEIDQVVAEILRKSTTDPIIIIQSDHGPRWEEDWERIFNAYHLPGEGQTLLYNNISPVNSFRLIFNYYFNAEYEMLEDR